MKFSSLSSAHLTGLRCIRAATATTPASGASTPFEPNAPPTSGTTTRIDSGGRSRTCTRLRSWRCVSCAEHHTVSRPSSASLKAIAPRVSIGAATSRGIE